MIQKWTNRSEDGNGYEHLEEHDMPRKPSLPPDLDPIGEERRSTLDRQFRASRAAFASFDAARDRSDKQLYLAIGRLSEFAATVGNDNDSLIAYAREHGVKVTKATSTIVAVAKLVITSDRKKASKYATVLQLASLRGIAPEADAIAGFIVEQGGIEACLRAYRERPRTEGGRTGGGRPSAYTQAMSRITAIASVAAPKDLPVSALDDGYFVVVGVRGEDGALRLLSKPVQDERVIKAAVASIAREVE